ncbi:hypothetical protein S7711_04995 [Stachybotrys chartarum IBT 7711]|uniref:Increased recombination centers protein 6 n=1 Tax=Stachybotrys chartarum (strain CBS 109288 / IBT 7711) TaxID=1280523 RepID=A0A084ARC9_STACB|nr:hypothetical protein S7711_04995 [Stachybotrys chartarum IBT 7711]KFA47919.1 hypothetical protein S40293_05165 [Stachybotrys chartarum IBT 40293]KFA79874.1 hypothetical protein S40288_03761 [Stachybotrys chartarum IBT 40288]
MAEIRNPRRILAVSLDSATQHLSRVIKDLTGTTPEPAATSLAGTTHDLQLKTAYYTATVPVWLDLIASPAEWAESFLSDEAGEVLAVLGAVVLVFALPTTAAAADAADQTRDLIRHLGRVVKDGLGGWEWDGVGLAVGVGEGDADQWDELCAEAGLEFVQLAHGRDGEKRNEFGEKTGIPRVKEALESNDWEQLDAPEAASDFGNYEEPQETPQGSRDLDPESLDFGFDRADFEGLKKAIWNLNDDPGADPAVSTSSTSSNHPNKGSTGPSAPDADAEGEIDEDEVAKVESMMRKLQAVREAGEGMSQDQRRRMAARAVEEVMKEL